ncbi:Gfo/Idh/MocA family protein [Nocardioides sp. NPDC051685]|uniref:Gfo/Idh/MocA family protein n=1 Tax=Nocardioides sp. NPDC051685 TaxID=3364334 RepID=UPI0037A7E015
MSTTTSAIAELAATGKPIGVGIIGLGAADSWAATSHKPALEAVDGYELRALSASSSESASRWGEVHGISRTFGTADDLAACDEVDLVIVAVKVPHHLELVTSVLEAGKPVLCEWPLGNGLAEAEQMAALAREQSVPTAVGLQARSHPAVRYLGSLVDDGYVGEVLSTTVVGSGGTWGGQIVPRNRYTLDVTKGASLLTIPFGHTLDGFASALGEPQDLQIRQARRRTASRDAETGEMVPMTVPDQIVASGTLPGGAVATFHYRGGMSRATNFRWEINGAEGDIVVTASTGHLQLATPTVEGARGAEKYLSPLPVPAEFIQVPTLDPVAQAPAYAVAHAYQQLLADLREGTSLVPDFTHAVQRHRSIAVAAH